MQKQPAQTSAFLLTPEQHRRQAALLRKSTDPKVRRLAQDRDNLARVIEARHSEPGDSKIGRLG
jgi:hypothetical protein